MNKYCITCKKEIIKKRSYKYCSIKCNNKYNNNKNRKQQSDWARNKRDKEANIQNSKKCQCLICGKYYIQVGSHIFQRHKMTARKYREYFKLEVKRGITPEWYRKVKGEQSLENGTYKNLEKGKKYHFKKGQKGIGIYERSLITIERLKKLYTFNKNKYESKNN